MAGRYGSRAAPRLHGSGVPYQPTVCNNHYAIYKNHTAIHKAGGTGMRSRTRRLVASTVVLCGFIPIGSRVHAADTSAQGELQEIVVVAERRSEKLQDVPIAVTAISESDLLEQGVRQAGDITAL